MMESTGCDGVAIGRGCLGRPWLFRDLADVFAGREPGPGPTFGEVADTMIEHAQLLADWYGAEEPSLLAFRKHAGWYTKGFSSSASLRNRLRELAPARAARLGTLQELAKSAPPAVIAEALAYTPQTIERHALSAAYGHYIADKRTTS